MLDEILPNLMQLGLVLRCQENEMRVIRQFAQLECMGRLDTGVARLDSDLRERF